MAFKPVDKKKLAQILTDHAVGMKKSTYSDADISDEMLKMFNDGMAKHMQKYPDFDIELNDYTGEADDKFIEDVLIPTSEKGGFDLFEAMELVHVYTDPSKKEMYGTGHLGKDDKGQSEKKENGKTFKFVVFDGSNQQWVEDDRIKIAENEEPDAVKDMLEQAADGMGISDEAINKLYRHVQQGHPEELNNVEGIIADYIDLDNSTAAAIRLKDESRVEAGEALSNWMDSIEGMSFGDNFEVVMGDNSNEGKNDEMEQLIDDIFDIIEDSETRGQVENIIANHFGKDLSSKEVDNVIAALKDKGVEIYEENKDDDTNESVDSDLAKDIATDLKPKLEAIKKEKGKVTVEDLEEIINKGGGNKDGKNTTTDLVMAELVNMGLDFDTSEDSNPNPYTFDKFMLTDGDEYTMEKEGKKTKVTFMGYDEEVPDGRGYLFDTNGKVEHFTRGEVEQMVSESEEAEPIDESQEGFGDIQDYYAAAKEALGKGKVRGLTKIYQGDGKPINYYFRFIHPTDGAEVEVAYNTDWEGIQMSQDYNDGNNPSEDDISIAGFRTYLFEEAPEAEEIEVSEAVTSSDLQWAIKSAKILNDWYSGEKDSKETAKRLKAIIPSDHPFPDEVENKIKELEGMPEPDSKKSSGSIWTWFTDIDNEHLHGMPDWEEADKELKKLINEEDINEESEYVEYLEDKPGEPEFEINGKKYKYVWARYPDGKRDIGAYAPSEDRVYDIEWFKANVLNESDEEHEPIAVDEAGDVSKIPTNALQATYDSYAEQMKKGNMNDAERKKMLEIGNELSSRGIPFGKMSMKMIGTMNYHIRQGVEKDHLKDLFKDVIGADKWIDKHYDSQKKKFLGEDAEEGGDVITDEMKAKVQDFLKENPSPADDAVHTLAAELGVSPHALEPVFYELAGEHVNEAGDVKIGGETWTEAELQDIKFGIEKAYNKKFADIDKEKMFKQHVIDNGSRKNNEKMYQALLDVEAKETGAMSERLNESLVGYKEGQSISLDSAQTVDGSTISGDYLITGFDKDSDGNEIVKVKDNDGVGDKEWDVYYEKQAFESKTVNENEIDYLELSDGNTTVSLYKEGGKWHEGNVVEGDKPYGWGSKTYDSYLDPEDIATWLNKDYKGNWLVTLQENKGEEGAEGDEVTDTTGEPVMESLIKSENELKVGDTYLTPSGLGGAFHVEYLGKNDKGRHEFKNINKQSGFYGQIYSFDDVSVLKEIHQDGTSVYEANEKELQKVHGKGTVYTDKSKFDQAMSYMGDKLDQSDEGDTTYYKNEKGDNLGVWDNNLGGGVVFDKMNEDKASDLKKDFEEFTKSKGYTEKDYEDDTFFNKAEEEFVKEYPQWAKSLGHIKESVMESEDEEPTMTYEECESYLQEKGISEEDIDKLTNKMVEMDDEMELDGVFTEMQLEKAITEMGIELQQNLQGEGTSAAVDNVPGSEVQDQIEKNDDNVAEEDDEPQLPGKQNEGEYNSIMKLSTQRTMEQVNESSSIGKRKRAPLPTFESFKGKGKPRLIKESKQDGLVEMVTDFINGEKGGKATKQEAYDEIDALIGALEPKEQKEVDREKAMSELEVKGLIK